MTNQAREIMGQVLDEKFRHTWTCLNYQDLVVFSEKYMELVVKECVDECLRMQLGNQYTPEELLFQTKYRKIIKEHFGVEE